MIGIPEADAQVSAVANVIHETLGEAIEAVYLYGSAIAGGLQPGSDIDLFGVTTRPLTTDERRTLVQRLTPVSSRSARPRSWRPIELTIVAHSDVVPWRYPSVVDLQWGEWLRAEYESGHSPERHINPDLAVLLAMVRLTGRSLHGPSANELLPRVGSADLVRAMVESTPRLLDDLQNDTANVLLTLARMWNTIETGDFSSKDRAADWARSLLSADAGEVLARARDVYRGIGPDDWSDASDRARRVADLLRSEIVDAASRRARGDLPE